MENKYLEDYYPHSNGYSDRALDAMDNNSYPMNHWTKETLLDTIGDVYGDDIVRKINEKKVNFETLKNIFLDYDGWHHTGSYYNELQ